MQEQIRRMIKQARRSEDRISADNRGDVARALAGRTIRWAQLAASLHMARSAEMIAQTSDQTPAQAPQPMQTQSPELAA